MYWLFPVSVNMKHYKRFCVTSAVSLKYHFWWSFGIFTLDLLIFDVTYFKVIWPPSCQIVFNWIKQISASCGGHCYCWGLSSWKMKSVVSRKDWMQQKITADDLRFGLLAYWKTLNLLTGGLYWDLAILHPQDDHQGWVQKIGKG